MLLLCITTAIAVTFTLTQHRGSVAGEIVFRIGFTAGFCIAIAARRNWARWVYAILLGFTWYALDGSLTSLLVPSFTLLSASTLATDLLQLAALILLFTGPSNRWFKQ